MITRDDVVLALSNSGETAELLTILPLIKRLGVPLVALTGRPDSTIAQAADANLDVSVAKEACPLGLAPTSSTTAAHAMGDALAVALLESRGFTSDDFARSQPSGILGRRLLLRVEDIMHTGPEMPRVAPGTPLPQALMEMTRKGLGMTVIAGDDGAVAGIFTDGDLRRALDRDIDLRKVTVDEVMSRKPRSIAMGALAAEALESMQSNRINALLVVDADGSLGGIVSMHDLLRAGVV
jgi:arabinose-5-phosphate isomerase